MGPLTMRLRPGPPRWPDDPLPCATWSGGVNNMESMPPCQAGGRLPRAGDPR